MATNLLFTRKWAVLEEKVKSRVYMLMTSEIRVIDFDLVPLSSDPALAPDPAPKKTPAMAA
jgi:hypothetical protein